MFLALILSAGAVAQHDYAATRTPDPIPGATWRWTSTSYPQVVAQAVRQWVRLSFSPDCRRYRRGNYLSEENFRLRNKMKALLADRQRLAGTWHAAGIEKEIAEVAAQQKEIEEDIVQFHMAPLSEAQRAARRELIRRNRLEDRGK